MPLEFEDRPAIGDVVGDSAKSRKLGVRILVAVGVLAALLAVSWMLGLIGGSGVLASLRLADGSEYMLTQSNNHDIGEPFTVAFYMRASPSAPWGWCYVDHQAFRWSNVAMTYDATTDTVTVTKNSVRRASLNRRQSTFWIDNGASRRELPAPQESNRPPDFPFPSA